MVDQRRIKGWLTSDRPENPSRQPMHLAAQTMAGLWMAFWLYVAWDIYNS